jgi:hypothetical protein
VDAFLDMVGAELARLIDENTDLRNQVKKHDQQRCATPADTENNLRPLGPPGRPIVPRPRMTTTCKPSRSWAWPKRWLNG